MKHIRKGFTLLETMIVIAVASIFVALVLPPIVNSLIVVQREATMLNMFRAADQAMAIISTSLRPAVLPMVTDKTMCDSGSTGTTIVPDTKGFRYAINTDRGFRQHGCEWRRIFTQGSSFLPFAIPVHLGTTQNSSDIDGLPFLGMIAPTSSGNAKIMGTDYETVTTANGTAYQPVKYPAAGGARTLHRALYSLNPTSFGSNLRGDPNNLNYRIYDETLTFPGTNDGYAVIRFVPLREGGVVRELDEAVLDVDLNDDGTKADSFAIGSIEIVYFDPSAPASGPFPKRIVTPPMVLLQLNTGADSYVPMFRLVSWGDPNRSPGQITWTPTPTLSRNGYTLLVNLLLFDHYSQQGNALAFERAGRPYLVRRFESMVELRNMSRQ